MPETDDPREPQEPREPEAPDTPEWAGRWVLPSAQPGDESPTQPIDRSPTEPLDEPTTEASDRPAHDSAEQAGTNPASDPESRPGPDFLFGWEPARTPGTALGEPTPRRGAARVVLAAIMAGLVLLAGGIGIGWILTRGGTTTGSQSPIQAATSPPQGQATRGMDVDAVSNKVNPAVVNVNTVIDSNPFDSIPARGRGAGTGMVISSNGQILTNNHVIQGATKIEVTIPGRSQTYTAQFIGADPSGDVALLQLQGASGLTTVTLGDSSSLSIGQQVVAIGNALGRGGAPTVTQGTITALGRSITIDDSRGGFEHLSDLIQTDALIQPGDSGGPLVNSAGQVVGMITAGSRTTRLQTASRVGYAITSTAALSVVNEIRAGHESSSIIIGQPGFLGIEVQELDADTARRLGLGSVSGVLVVGASQGTPAAEAGISDGSVITAINGENVTSIEELGSVLHRFKPGEQVRVTWVDANGTHTESARLIEGPAV